MKYYLVKFARNWADEFDCAGFRVMDEKLFKMIEEVVNDPTVSDQNFSFYFGTNEGWDDYSILEFWDDLKKTEISFSTYQLLIRTFDLEGPSASYGIFPDIEYIFEDFQENEAVEQFYADLELYYGETI